MQDKPEQGQAGGPAQCCWNTLCRVAGAQVITQEGPKGEKLEPYEEAVVEVPEAHMGGVVDLMGSRKGQMLDMASGAESTNRVTYKIPTRGLLGLRNAILTATKVPHALSALP